MLSGTRHLGKYTLLDMIVDRDAIDNSNDMVPQPVRDLPEPPNNWMYIMSRK